MVNKRYILKQAEKAYNYVVFNSRCNGKLFSKIELDNIKKCVQNDLEFFFESDPAADNAEVIKITYPGFLAVVYHRLSYILFNRNERIPARIISEYVHSITGIDIHPAAKVGCPFFIDHGTGVVIGETSIIGDFVRIYQGVTLGALSPAKGQSIKGVKRHPTIGNNVTIYAGASILGDITIGNNVTIGGGVFILDNIKDNTRVSNPKPILDLKEKSNK